PIRTSRPRGLCASSRDRHHHPAPGSGGAQYERIAQRVTPVRRQMSPGDRPQRRTTPAASQERQRSLTGLAVAAEPTSHQPSPLDDDPAFPLHRGGTLEMRSPIPVRSKDDRSPAYTPGVARVCTAIADRRELAYDYSWTSKVVAVVTAGTAVLGLGDIGPAASMPVMEGKSLLFKEFADVDSVPIALNTTDVDESVDTV